MKQNKTELHLNCNFVKYESKKKKKRKNNNTLKIQREND